MTRAYMTVTVKFVYSPSTAESHEAEMSAIMQKAMRGQCTMAPVSFEEGELIPLDWDFATPERWSSRDLTGFQCKNGDWIRKPEKVKR